MTRAWPPGKLVTAARQRVVCGNAALGGDRFRLCTLRQGKRAEEANVVSLIVVGNYKRQE